LAILLVLSSLLVANYVAWLRLKPEVSAISWIAEKPDYENHLVNIHRLATVRANGGADSLLPIYDVQDPGFFLLVAELFARAGSTTPLPLEILSIALFNIGAICFFFWVYLLFSDPAVAASATAFLALSKFFLFFPGVTHTMPFEFVFFNATILLFVLFLRSNKNAYLIGALAAMFMTCMNYWFYYLSSWIIMIGLWWQYRGPPKIKEVALISTPPIAAVALTTVMIMSLFGGVWRGAMRLADVLVARTVDARLPGGSWFPDQKFMTTLDWVMYPATVATRLEWSYSIQFFSFSIASIFTLFFLSIHNRQALVSALILLAGGLAWYCVMVQHTYIHRFAGEYCFMAVCPIFGLTVAETARSVRKVVMDFGRVSGAGLRKRLALVTVLGFRNAAAMLFIMVSVFSLGAYLTGTYGLVRETVILSGVAEQKYAEVIRTLCRQHSEITLADLKSASKDWGLEWQPSIIADTNRLPKCAG